MKSSVKNKIKRKSATVKRNLNIGKKIELEHRGTIKKIIDNPKITVEKAAELIAKDHIKEMPDYYDKLIEMESEKMENGGVTVEDINYEEYRDALKKGGYGDLKFITPQERKTMGYPREMKFILVPEGEDRRKTAYTPFGLKSDFGIMVGDPIYQDGGATGNEIGELEMQIQEAFKQPNKWHFINKTVDGHSIKLKFFIGVKEVDVQIFQIDGIDMTGKIPGYGKKRETYKALMDALEPYFTENETPEKIMLEVDGYKTSLDDFIKENTAPGVEPPSEESMNRIKNLKVGESYNTGGAGDIEIKRIMEDGGKPEGKEYKNILDMPKEERIEFIKKSIELDPYYTEEKGSYNTMAIYGNEIIEKYFPFNKDNPFHVKGELVYFEPDKRTIKRDGYVVAQAKYGVHFITHKSGDGKRRFFAGHKNNAIKYILQVLENPTERVIQTKGHGRQEGIVYITKIEVDNHCCMILRGEVDSNGRLEVVTVYPDQTHEDIQKKKASNIWLDAPFGNFTEQPPVGKVVSGLSGDTDISRTQYKDTKNNDTNNDNNQKNLKMGGNIENLDDLIEIVEKNGKIRWKYEVEESAYNGSGNAIMYDYNGRAYEIITWNEDAKDHEPGSKTIGIGEEKLANGSKTPEIKGLGKFIPIAKIKEITEYFDNHKKPHAGEDPEHAEGYAWLGAMEKYSILGDDTIVNRILAEHEKGKSLMDIHKEIKKMEDGGIMDTNRIIREHPELLNTGLEILSEDPELLAAFEDGGKTENDDELMEMLVKYHGSDNSPGYGTFEKIFRNQKSGKNALIVLIGNYWRAGKLNKINPELVKYIKENNMDAIEKYVSILKGSKNEDAIEVANDIENFFKSKLEDGGRSGKEDSMKELLEQSSALLENRYLQGRIDESEYKQRKEFMNEYAKKHNIEFEHGGKTKKQPASLYFPDDKLDYTNKMLIEHGWATIGGRIEDFHKTLKNKGREAAYKEIKKQYAESADDVYRSLLVLDRLNQMEEDTTVLYMESLLPAKLKSFEKNVQEKLAKNGEWNNYLISKAVKDWDNYDYANYTALKHKHNFSDGGNVEKDTIKQLIADGFINEDHTLTNKGRRIADLHKFCFPIGAHPFSYVSYNVEDLYSKPQYVLISDTIYYTDGFLVYELGGHLTEALRDTAVQNHSLENSVVKTISKNLTEFIPFAYCPGISIDEKVNAGEGFIVFSNLVNSNNIYVNAFIYNYVVRNYQVAKWMADPNGGSLIHAVSSDGATQAILMVNANAVGVNPAFTLFDRDKLMGDLRNKYTELFIKGESYKKFIGDWKPSQVPSEVQKPADLENTIRGLEVLVEMEDDEKEIKRLNSEIYKLKSLLK